jgi:hypothetical protein
MAAVGPQQGPPQGPLLLPLGQPGPALQQPPQQPSQLPPQPPPVLIPNVAQEPGPYLFRVMTEQIKNIIKNLKSSIHVGNQEEVNGAVITAIKKLENLDTHIVPALDHFLDGINIKERNIHINRERGTTIRTNDYGGITVAENPNAHAFLYNPLTTTDDNGIRQYNRGGVLEQINFSEQGQNLDEIRTFQVDGTIANDGLEPDYREGDLDLSNEGNLKLLQSRLINCQYLEILYLTKHEELMKIFAFTLNLYDKYTYSIKILLFVLKNLFEPYAPPGCPTPQAPGEKPKIRLPKALIINIKQLLKDQKQVQNIINQMRETVDTTVPNLVNKDMGIRVANTPGNLMVVDSPSNFQAERALRQEEIQGKRQPTRV